MIKVGIDMTTISRFDDFSEYAASRLLSNSEFKQFQETENKNLFLATHWAIKEAIFKADNTYSDFSDLTITKDTTYHFENFSISVSNEGDYVIAVAIKN